MPDLRMSVCLSFCPCVYFMHQSTQNGSKRVLFNSKESRGVLGQASKQAGKHLGVRGHPLKPCPVGACLDFFKKFILF